MAYYSLKLEIEKRPVYIGQEDTDKFFSDENTLYDPVIGEMPSPIPAGRARWRIPCPASSPTPSSASGRGG